MKPYKLVGTILSLKGNCSAGQKVGEKFELSLWDPEKDATRRTPALCAFFYDMIFPYHAVLQFGGVPLGRRQGLVSNILPRPS